MTAKGPSVLVIDDEAPMRKLLRTTLEGHDYTVHEAASGADGLVAASTRNPDLVLLDLGLPDLDGVEVTRRLREWANCPIIVISARGREEDKIAALDAGADDYLTKPFGAGELLARLRVAFRRVEATRTGGEPEARFGELRIDFAHRLVFVGEREVHLTPTEYKLLALLAQHAGKVLTHRQILKEVWGPAYAEQTHYLRVYMAQLRHKLEADPARPTWLVTEPAVGYRLRAT